jgi:uncharacterized damage-inducible protein DinB
MPPTETTLSALERNWQMVDAALADMDDQTMGSQPNEVSNSAAWTLWHLNRVCDNFIHMRFQDKAPLWTSDGWHEKFGMASDPADFGMGWDSAKVAAWEAPSKDILFGYATAVRAATKAYLESLTEEGLAKQVPFPAPPNTVSIGDALGVLLNDNLSHGGQIAYLRGYYGGMGWYR